MKFIRFAWPYDFEVTPGLPVTMNGERVGRVIKVLDGEVEAEVLDIVVSYMNGKLVSSVDFSVGDVGWTDE